MANPNQPNLGQTKQELRDIAAMTEDTFRSVADNIQSMFKDALEQGQNVSKSLGNDISNNLKALARQSADSLNNQEKLRAFPPQVWAQHISGRWATLFLLAPRFLSL
jgi:hypothetical protein